VWPASDPLFAGSQWVLHCTRSTTERATPERVTLADFGGLRAQYSGGGDDRRDGEENMDKRALSAAGRVAGDAWMGRQVVDRRVVNLLRSFC